jgi:hypothetical protein
MAFEDEIEYNLLELWCLRMRESEDGWRLTALDEILTWMKMDTIIINLTMEAELVDYQLKEGIAAGKKEIMKVYSTLMTAPMIFTTLSDPL